MTVRCLGGSRMLAPAVALSLLLPGVTQAHVKWFCGPIDQSLPPVPPREVLSSLFGSSLVAFATLVAAGGLVDALLARFLSRAAVKAEIVAIAADVMLRVGMAAYALCLWRDLAVVPWADSASTPLLTPDLLDRNRLVGLLQLSIAILVLIPRLSTLAAAGLAALYAMGVAKYGMFYMIDYLFFLGFAAYLALSDPWLNRHRPLAPWRVPVLTAGISISLMWTAVEKFLFPQWTIAVLVFHPGVTGGYPFATVATIGGFVEFSLSFYLLVGRAVLGRLAALLLMFVFLLAMPEFGTLDIVGHISVLSILLAVVLHGETRLQQLVRGGGSGALPSFARVGGLYIAMLASLTLLYYGLHALSVLA